MFSSVYSNSSRTYYSSNMPDVNVKKVSNNMNLNTIIRLANTPYYDYVTAPVHTPNMNMNTIIRLANAHVPLTVPAPVTVTVPVTVPVTAADDIIIRKAKAISNKSLAADDMIIRKAKAISNKSLANKNI